ncbi:hemerythrin domain-containing protein [Chitinilyticum aquatile]|uniref:hemerythrin domain-containing protein n=1 Tax=Chitinilyticum aquatile TaxID=362520 RepID=UPI00040DE1F1|nr:hemerythrin domain-containing protein [Chitinilyticum aquatile]
MKRSPALIHFSREHHPALVLAKRIQRAQADELAGLLPSITFLGDLEKHFVEEETQFAPTLAALPQLAERFDDDHAALRALMHRLQKGELAALAEFAQRLEAHVRFEERELFPALELLASSAGTTGG